MNRKPTTRERLLERWRFIEEEDENDVSNSDSSQNHHLRYLKEQWFADAFKFLISLPREDHVWCHGGDIMEPLLETFFNFFKDESDNSPLKILWSRITEEMKQCTHCISQYHQAQEVYQVEYDSEVIGPLLVVLRSLDEARVTEHLMEINARMVKGAYDPVNDSAEVVSLMFEVFTYPILMDDQSLVSEFQVFIEFIDNEHELALAGHQQYPGVYALLFSKSRRSRAIGHRLAARMEKLKRATDLEPLQPLLKKYIGCLEAEVVPSDFEISRPRVQLDRLTVWLGVKALLAFLEPSAFEEGILECYPSFFSIVLNHISDDSVEFSHAVVCLRLLFEMLGCKLWLRSSLSPSVLRNTLLGQCFHSRNEKSHKEMFDLFQPFLQSLEALQDGEHEEQRRRFLYFLLHQVPISSNFSALMRKKASQIAFLIILRGYKMNPPCPPFECAHMWCPPLVSALKDSSLHSSLRQPAFDLIQAIIVSDAAVLVSSLLDRQTSISSDGRMLIELDIEDEDDMPLLNVHADEKIMSCWDDFSEQSKITSAEFRGWMCIPMLWIDVLVGIDLSVLPLHFSKAAFWARSRLLMVEPENCTDMEVPIQNWLVSFAKEVSPSFGWKPPTGSDDGKKGKESRNSVKVATMHLPLVRIFKRLTSHFVGQITRGDFLKQWTWEPRMGESLILSLLESNDMVRHVSRCILEEVSSTRGLSFGLKFLCSFEASLSAIFLGLKHAFKLVQLESVLLNFQMLHNFFFVLCKMLKEGISYSPVLSQESSVDVNVSRFSSQGGFLRQPVLESSPANDSHLNPSVGMKYREKFVWLVSEISWPAVKNCLVEGKAFINNNHSQMTCIRVLEILPLIFERLHPSVHRLSGNIRSKAENVYDYKWLHDLIDWGNSSLEVVVRYWKQALMSLLEFIKCSSSENAVGSITVILNLLSSDNFAMDELAMRVSRLSVSLSSETYHKFGKPRLYFTNQNAEGIPLDRKKLLPESKPMSSEVAETQIINSAAGVLRKEGTSIIVISDDESDKFFVKTVSSSVSSQDMLDKKTTHPNSDQQFSQGVLATKESSTVDSAKKLSQVFQLRDDNDRQIVSSEKKRFDMSGNKVSAKKQTSIVDPSKKRLNAVGKIKSSIVDPSNKLSEAFQLGNDYDSIGLLSKKENSETSVERLPSSSAIKSTSSDGRRKEKNSSSFASYSPSSVSETKCNKNNSSTVTTKPILADQTSSKLLSDDTVIKEVVGYTDTEDDPWELAFRPGKRPELNHSKLGTSGLKRQVIQLNVPVNRSGYSHRLEAGVKRFSPPRLDDWFKPILNIDYFLTVGLSSTREDKNQDIGDLKEVPVTFNSPEEYVDVFRPLVLEELKAQLRSSFQEMSSIGEMFCGNLSVLSVERIDDFHQVRFIHDEDDSLAAKSLSENDLVLLTKQPLNSTSHDVHLIGKVERREKENKQRSNILTIRFFLQNGSTRSNRARVLLIERSKWYAGRIMSIVPQLREFQALSSIRNIPILDTILKPINNSVPYIGSRTDDLSLLPQPLQKILVSSFNGSQIQAIGAAIGSSGSRKSSKLSLIQGPPGTGKTRTIVAIVSSLLASAGQRRHDTSGIVKPSTTQPTASRPQIRQSVAIARAWQDAALARQLNEDVQKSSASVDCSGRGRVLLCAQSNAAVDELVARIASSGLYGSDGKTYKPYLVRVGNAKTVHSNSLPFFIDTLIDQRLVDEKMMSSDEKFDSCGEKSMALRSSLEKLVDSIRLYEAKRANLKDKNSDVKNSIEDGSCVADDGKEMSDAEIGVTLRKLYEQKKQIYADLATAQAREKRAKEETRALKHKLRKSILREAQIVVTTLSGCGGDLYGVCSESSSSYKFGPSSENTLFDAVVIDEAAQALEPATLIPLQLLKSNGTKCIMVGDPKQLPATVLSNIACKFSYQCSMFERLQKGSHPVVMLTEQYRMHPEICQFPSRHFYENKLMNGVQMSSKSAPFHETKTLGPYVVFDVIDGQEAYGNNSGTMSLCNEHEANAAVEVLRFFKRRYPSEFVGGRIGIITPYKCQLSLLRSRFSNTFGSSVTADMEFNTVDGFQGREVDILIVSTVRATDTKSSTSQISSSNIGFVADVRRMNVALTRAKLSLWIFGNTRTLQTNHNWAALIKDAKERNVIITAKMPYGSMFDMASKKHPDYDSRYLKHSENSKATEKSAKLLGRTYRENYNKKESEVQYNKRMANHAKLDIGDGAQVNRKRARYDSQSAEEKVPPSSLSVVREKGIDVIDGESKDTARDPKTGKTRKEKGIDEQVSRLQPKGYHGQDRSRIKTHASASSTEGVQKKQANGGCGTPQQAETSNDRIMKRKQQREAVDALLSSSLISSKKSDASSILLPAKKPVPNPPTIKPSRPWKAPPTS